MIRIESQCNTSTASINFKTVKNSSHLMIQQSNKVIIETIQLSESEYQRQCRICFDNQSSEDNLLLSPCKCTGSVEWVHDKCYRLWIEQLFKNKDQSQRQEIKEKGIQCELCKQTIELSFEINRQCAPYSEINQKISKNPLLFLIFLLFIVINSIIQIFLCYYAFDNLTKVQQTKILMGILVSIFLFLFIALILTIIYFILQFFINKSQILKYYQAKMQKRSRKHSRNQILPQTAQGHIVND